MAAKIPNISTLIQAGINPKTGLPYKMGGTKPEVKENVKKFLRLKDEQDAVNRGTWYNLPCNITSQELERMLYYKGQLAFFYLEELDEFYFMPYALDGTIDFYGRYNSIHPVPMTSGTDDKFGKAQAEYLSEKKLKCVYGIKMPGEVTYEDFVGSAVLLHDYTKQLSQNIIPRQQINEGLLDVEAEMIPFLRTALLEETGVKGVRVQDADQAESVQEGSNSLVNAAMTGDMYVPIVGGLEFQELTSGNGGKAQDYLLAMEALDNFRLSGYGIENGGLFKKGQYQNNQEVAMNNSSVSNQLQDAISIRQNFCNICNSIWGTSMWYEPSGSLTNVDVDGDGLLYNNDGAGSNTGVESSGEVDE